MRSFAIATLMIGGVAMAASPIVAQGIRSTAHYVETRDGTRIAVDINLPVGREGSRYPALFELTRYGRSHEHPTTGEKIPSLGPLDRFFLDNGYAVVKVDARGSGASFGSRSVEYGPDEVRDAYDVVEWAVGQPWSDGNVGAYGTSYSGTTAELLAAVGHPAVKAVIPGWSDFDTYVSPVRPYGMLASSFMRLWGSFVGWMDENNVERLGRSIRRADEDADGSLLAAALGEHEANADVFETVVGSEFRDDAVGEGHTWDALAPIYWKDEIEASGVPMLVLTSWLDAGTADGTLLRFRHFDNPQSVVLMATNHGGGAAASPFRVSDTPVAPTPSTDEQANLRLQFFDHHLKGADNGVDQWAPLRYWMLGEEAFRESDVWPPHGVRTRTLHFRAGGSLAGEPGTVDTDDYAVDPAVSTGSNNRWMTQMGEPVLRLDDRAAMDARMLTYTTAPMSEPVDLAGTPVVRLRLATDRSDGAVFVYLEDVAPDGRSRYLTEGGLRLVHRKTVENPHFDEGVPYHSFARVDAQPVTPGEMMEVDFQLWPIAAVIAEGHRLRVAIAGADANTFDLLPADGATTLGVSRGGDDGSRIELPVVER
ncbi:MAG: CocE/NonD family hydrolase [Gemmatimonadota bacterium]|nr:CocE/NonD family hydrolase [Gemmatimonadota bacterium]